VPVNDPTEIPRLVRAARRQSGWTLAEVSAKYAAESGSSPLAVLKHWSAWETGAKSLPRLSSLGPYLRAHGLMLNMTTLERDRAISPWCTARRMDAFRTRCAMAVGHAGPHRTYAGMDFR
jgi:hypothetical protein